MDWMEGTLVAERDSGRLRCLVPAFFMSFMSVTPSARTVHVGRAPRPVFCSLQSVFKYSAKLGRSPNPGHVMHRSHLVWLRLFSAFSLSDLTTR